MSTASTKPITLFYIYARKDEDLLDELEKQLAPLKRKGYLVGWHDRQIEAGREWQKEIEAHLSEANIILMLLSADFTNSDACEDEMRRAMTLYEKGHTQVIPILLRPCLWQVTAIADLQVLPANGQPITAWPNRDEAFHHVAYHLANIVLKQYGLPLLQARNGPLMLSPLPPPSPDPSQPLVDTPSFRSRNPYRGLEAFRQEDAGDFFGRDNLVAKLVLAFQKITFPAQPNGNARLLSVVGPSGSGKSSVIEAGLVPALKRNYLPGSEHWLYLGQMRPGPNPLETLAITLAPHFPQKPMSLLLQELSDSSTSGLHFLLQTLTRGQATVAFLHIDQFEEVFTQTLEREHRDFFLNLLLTALTASRSSLAIVTSLRADFYDRPMQLFPDLFRLMKKAQVEVLPLDRHDLLDVIRLPAALPDVRLQFEDKLVNELLAEMHRQSGALPLLQFMLYQLFQTREGKRILTLDAYNKIGGVQGALHNHAEDILASVGPENLDLTRSLFLCLVEPGADQNPIRRRLILNELVIDDPIKRALKEIVDRFTNARLLIMTEQNEKIMVEVSHEAIIRGWQRLAHWLRAASEDLYQQRRLREDALNWHRHGFVGMLYHDDQLWRTNAWIQSYQPLLSRSEVEFLQASMKKQREIEEQRRKAQEEMEEEVRRVLRQREREMEEQRRRLNRANAMARPFVRRTVLFGLGGISLVAATGAATGIIEWFAHQPTTLPSSPSRLNLPFVGQAHTGSVKSVAWSPDSAHLASASADKTIRIWDAGSGSSSACTGHTGSVNGVAWSPDGAHLASASADQTVRTWDATSRLSQLNLSGHTGAVNSVAWSPDNMRVASASDDRTVRLWDTSSSNPQDVQQNLRGYTGHSGAVNSAVWSPDGGRVASASADQTVHIWDSSTVRTLLIYRGHSDVVNSVAWSPDGKYIASASADQTVRIWNPNNGQISLTYRGHSDIVESVAWSPDGKWLVSASSNNEKAVHVWSASGGWTVLAYTDHTNAVNSVAWSPSGTRIASASDDATMRIWDASIFKGRTVATYATHTDAVKSVAWSPDGTRLASSSDDKSVLVWDTGDGKAPLTYNIRNDIVDCVAWSPDGTRLAFASADKTVQVWDSRNGQSLLICPGHTGAVNGIAWSPDGKQLASASADATARLWDATSGKPLFAYTGHSNAVNSIAWSPDGLYLASASDDGTAQVWDASSGKSSITCTGHTGSVNSVAWSPDSQQIVSASDDATARIWNATGGLSVRTYTGQNSSVHSAAWSPDGKFIASASYDTTVAVWDASTGSTQLTYKGHHRSVNSVAWSPDRKHLASASDDSTVQVWLWLQT